MLGHRTCDYATACCRPNSGHTAARAASGMCQCHRQLGHRGMCTTVPSGDVARKRSLTKEYQLSSIKRFKNARSQSYSTSGVPKGSTQLRGKMNG